MPAPKLSNSVWKTVNLKSSGGPAPPSPSKNPFLHVPCADLPRASTTDDLAHGLSAKTSYIPRSTRSRDLLSTPGGLLPSASAPFLSSPSPLLTSPLTLGSPIIAPSSPASSLNASAATLVEPLIGAGEFVPLRVLGEGGFGKVFQVQDTVTGTQYALKVIQKAKLRSSSRRLVRHEQRVLRALSGNAEFLPLYASWHDTENFYLVTKCFARGDLRTDMRRAKKYKPDVARFYAAEIVTALEKLHSAGIVHRDLKPENILLDDEGHVVLADFGLARMFKFAQRVEAPLGEGPGDEADVTRSACGTLRYMAPEAIEGKPYSYGVDLWALGVILHMMLCGQCPYAPLGINKKDKKEFKEAVLKTELVLRSRELDVTSRDLLNKLLCKDPESRATIEDIKKHAYFADLDWTSVARREKSPPELLLYDKSPPTVSGLKINAGVPYAANEDRHPEYTYISTALRGHKYSVAIKYLEAPTPTAELQPVFVSPLPTLPTFDEPLLPSPKRWQFKIFLLRVFRAHHLPVIEADAGVAGKHHVEFSAWLSVRHDSLLDALAQVDEADAEAVRALGVFERLKEWLRRHRVQMARRRACRVDLE